MKNMSRQDDAGLTGQGIGETPRTDENRFRNCYYAQLTNT
jgi:hypothetical protein